MIAPMVLLLWFGKIAEKGSLKVAARLSRRLALFGVLALAGGLALVLPPSLERLSPYQPMRIFILRYVFLLLLGGGLLRETVLRRVAWRWVILLLPMALVMFFAERSLSPASPHVELPGITFHNDWT